MGEGRSMVIPEEWMQKHLPCRAAWAYQWGAAWRSLGLYGEADFALQLALQKGKRAASVRHDCKASASGLAGVSA